MKKIGFLAVALATFLSSQTVSFATSSELGSELVNAVALAQALIEKNAANVINWSVGESAEFALSMQQMGTIATMKKYVDREEGGAVWINQEMSGMMSQKTETKIDRATGKILDYIENGQHKTPPDVQIEIISQDQQSVTVPAGTFETIHIVAKTNQEQVKQMEIWLNPRDIVMEGMAQMKMSTSMMPLMIQLTKFHRP